VCSTIRDPVTARTLSKLVDWMSGEPGESLRGIRRRAWNDAGASLFFADLVAIQSKLGQGDAEALRRQIERLSARMRGRSIGSLVVQRLLRALERPTDRGWPGAMRSDGMAPGLFRWGAEAKAMHVMHAIPAVLQLVTDAEHEQAALTGAATWARRQAGADAIAFIGGDEGRAVAIDGWTGGLPDADRMLAVRTHELRVIDRGASRLVVAPMRYAGACVGGLLVLGPAERAESLEEIARTLAAVCAPALRARLDAFEATGRGRTLLPEILGQSPAAAGIRDAVIRCAATPFPVLIEGESGTGKELVARAVHRLSARRDRRFCAVNCAALSDDLVEAELFGHTRGAFTGAVAPRAGLFEEAHGGTLFLDEVGELSPRAQAKLLRVLQEREIRRVGENVSRAIDVRIVAATNRSLAEASAHGAFRNDLLFRLAVVRIRLPPLRGRAEDIALLAQSFWRRMTIDLGKRAVMSADVLARLSACDWPGNIRELQNIIAGLAVLAPARGRVTRRHVEQVLADAGAAACRPPMSLERARWSCEQQTVSAALARHAGRRTAAARELGLTRQGLTKAIRRLRIRDERFEGVA
jgi:transcriptional regulator with GAF, ATPase, and Fis domain